MITDTGEPWRLSATRLSARLAAGKIAPTDLLDHVLRRVDAVNPAINAIVALCPDARAAAEESEARLARGEARSPLEGIPLTVTDNIPVKGVVATWGSRVFADFVPDRDELAVDRLRAAGAVVVGKTNAPEFTLDGYTGNLLFGTTRNPWDLRLTPGGSSG
ncbi:MAG: amidase, partial [Alphaproteobacteria bacterium]